MSPATRQSTPKLLNFSCTTLKLNLLSSRSLLKVAFCRIILIFVSWMMPLCAGAQVAIFSDPSQFNSSLPPGSTQSTFEGFGSATTNRQINGSTPDVWSGFSVGRTGGTNSISPSGYCPNLAAPSTTSPVACIGYNSFAPSQPGLVAWVEAAPNAGIEFVFPASSRVTAFSIDSIIDWNDGFDRSRGELVLSDGSTVLITRPATSLSNNPTVFRGFILDETSRQAGIYIDRLRWVAISDDAVGFIGVRTFDLGTSGELDDLIEEIEQIVSDDLFYTTRNHSRNASRISARAADRLSIHQCHERIGKRLRSNPIYFASGSHLIASSSNPTLDAIASILESCEEAGFRIEGHTDSDGSHAYNLTLSQQRVDAVTAELVARGIAAKRLHAQGFGEERPVATNETEEGRALNRRVVFVPMVDVSPSSKCATGSFGHGSIDANYDAGSGFLKGFFGSEKRGCASGNYRTTWIDADYTDAPRFGTQGMVTFGISNESRSNEVIRGLFIEGYLSRSQVNALGYTGDIEGFGIHGGVFGARMLNETVKVNYYGSSAVGVHDFGLVGDSASASGDYSYLGIFGGAALSGERSLDHFGLRPSLGLDLAFSRASGETIDLVGDLDIEPTRYVRGFVDLGILRSGPSNASLRALEFTPGLFCETIAADRNTGCGYSAEVAYNWTSIGSGFEWGLEAGYEQIDNVEFYSAILTQTWQVQTGNGALTNQLSIAESGAVEVGAQLEIDW